MESLFGMLAAMCVTMVLIPPLMHAGTRWNVLDQPSERKVHAQPVPRVGGIAMATGMLLAVAIWGEFVQPMPALLAGVIVLLVFGVWDDRVTLGVMPKLIGQTMAVLIVMLWGDVRIDTLTLDTRHVLPSWIAWPLTFGFLLGVTNAINLADGLDGLAGGTTVLSLSALALLGFSVDNDFVALVAAIVTGSVLGFLRFNTFPARVFMGDGGSQILGFTTAVLAVCLTQDPATPLSSALPLLLLGIPIIDTLMVMTRRALARTSPFRADRNHLHHRLLALGLRHHEAVAAIYLMQAVLFVIAWLMRFESDVAIALSFLSALVIVTIVLQMSALRHIDFSRSGSQEGRLGIVTASPRGIAWCSAGLAALYLFSVLLRARAPSLDLHWLAAMMAALLIADTALHWRAARPGPLSRLIIYVVAALAVYLDHHAPTRAPLIAEAVLFGALALTIGIHLRGAGERRFRMTPLDLLVMFLAVAIPNLPGSGAPEALGISAAKLVILFYALEALTNCIQRGWRWMHLSVVAWLLACGPAVT